MKFLCLECNTPMKLFKTAPPNEGSLDVRFECPQCLHQVAMLTNPLETQIVSSLGVKIGSESTVENSDTASTESSCPLVNQVASDARQSAAQENSPKTEGEMPWSDAARVRLDRIPPFVRPMAVSGIEQFARENGFTEIDENVLDQAKERFGM